MAKKKKHKKCAGLNAKGKLKTSYRWKKGHGCPIKAAAKKAHAKKKKSHKKTRSMWKRGGRKSGDVFSLTRDYEAWKMKHGAPSTGPELLSLNGWRKFFSRR